MFKVIFFKATQLENDRLRFKPFFEGHRSSCFTYCFVLLLIDLRASIYFQSSNEIWSRKHSVSSNKYSSISEGPRGGRSNTFGLGRI